MDAKNFDRAVKTWIESNSIVNEDVNNIDNAQLFDIKEIYCENNLQLNRCMYRITIPSDNSTTGLPCEFRYATTEKLALNLATKDIENTTILDYEIF